MKKLLVLAIAGIVLFVLSGCDGDGVDDGRSGSSLKIDITQNFSTTSYDSSINLMNSIDSSSDICSAYSAPTRSNSWARLSGMPIRPGNDHEWGSNHCDENWDLKVVGCNGEEKIKTYYRECFTTTYFTFRSW